MIKDFANLLFSGISNDEVIYLSLSARNKYLSEEDRELYNLGRSEMFNRKILYEPKHFIYTLKEMSVFPQYSKKGTKLPIEPNILTVYANINPCSLSIAFHKTSQKFYDAILNGSSINPYAQYKTELQRSRSRKNFIDLDLDVPFLDEDEKLELIIDIKKSLHEYANIVYAISTKSGAHFLLSDITGNYTKVLESYRAMFLGNKNFEFVLNSNQMVPVPGTNQSDYKVKFVLSDYKVKFVL